MATAAKKPSCVAEDFLRLSWNKLTPPISPEEQLDLQYAEHALQREVKPGMKVMRVEPVVTSIALDPFGCFLGVGHLDGVMVVWDLRSIPTVVSILDPRHYWSGQTTERSAVRSDAPDSQSPNNSQTLLVDRLDAQKEAVFSICWSHRDLWILAVHETAMFLWDLGVKTQPRVPVRMIRLTRPCHQVVLMPRVGHLPKTTDTASHWHCFLSYTTDNKGRNKLHGDLPPLNSSKSEEVKGRIQRMDLLCSDDRAAAVDVTPCFPRAEPEHQFKPISMLVLSPTEAPSAAVAIISDRGQDESDDQQKGPRGFRLLMVGECSRVSELEPASLRTLKQWALSSIAAGKKFKWVSARLSCDEKLLVSCCSHCVMLHEMATFSRLCMFQDVISRTRFSDAHVNWDCSLVIGVSSREGCGNGSRSLFMWKRHELGHMQYMPGPSRNGLLSIHFRAQRHGTAAYQGAVLAALSARGAHRGHVIAPAVFLLTPVVKHSWFGPFFSPQFVFLNTNEEYVESEGEFDERVEGDGPGSSTTISKGPDYGRTTISKGPGPRRKRQAAGPPVSVVNHFCIDGASPAMISARRRSISVHPIQQPMVSMQRVSDRGLQPFFPLAAPT